MDEKVIQNINLIDVLVEMYHNVPELTELEISQWKPDQITAYYERRGLKPASPSCLSTGP